jgi:hypothetical protein
MQVMPYALLKFILMILKKKQWQIIDSVNVTCAWITAAVLACGGRYAAGFCAVGLAEGAFVDAWVGFGPW